MSERPVVLYDGNCRFCRWSARMLVRLDRHERLGFLPLDDPQAGALLAPLSSAERIESWRLVAVDGQLLGGAAAGSSVLTVLGARRLADATRRWNDVGERIYRATATHRGWLGHLVPDGAGPHRYP